MALLCAAALASCLSLALLTSPAGGAEATVAKKKCKKAKASTSAKNKCKASFVPESGNYGLQASDGRWIGSLMRYERLGLYPDPRPYLGPPNLFLKCTDNRGNYFPAKEIELGAATRLSKSSRAFDFSGPFAGDPRFTTGTFRITGRWVSSNRIVGTLQVTNLATLAPPAEDGGPDPMAYTYSCLNESVDYVAYL